MLIIPAEPNLSERIIECRASYLKIKIKVSDNFISAPRIFFGSSAQMVFILTALIFIL